MKGLAAIIDNIIVYVADGVLLLNEKIKIFVGMFKWCFLFGILKEYILRVL